MNDGQNYLQQEWYAFTDFLFRPDYFISNSFSFRYNHYNFSEKVDTIPGFEVAPQEVQEFFSLNWFFKNDHRDAHDYPLKGYRIDLELNHSIPYRIAHNSYLKTNVSYYRQLQGRFYYSAGFSGKLTFARSQPYYLQQGLGYGHDYVRGYEYYVIDGQHFALLKNNLKFALVPQRTDKISFIPTEKFNKIPWAVYLTAFADAGYVYHYDNPDDNRYSSGNFMENSLLVGYGCGLEVATYYDFVIRAEVSRNRLGQTGIFLHFSTAI
jgi:hemolysin activation/secretion protein